MTSAARRVAVRELPRAQEAQAGGAGVSSPGAAVTLPLLTRAQAARMPWTVREQRRIRRMVEVNAAAREHRALYGVGDAL